MLTYHHHQAGVQSTLINELEDKLSIRNKEFREVESKRAELERKLIEIENTLARKVSDLDTAHDKNKDLRFGLLFFVALSKARNNDSL